MSPIFPDPRLQQGFAAVVAVFILIVLGGLGVVMITVFGGQQRSAAYDALGTRAYQAARAGIEVGTVLAIGGTCGANNFAIAPFTVSVQCVATTHFEGTTQVTVFQITSTACTANPCPGAAGPNYIERQLRATVTP